MHVLLHGPCLGPVAPSRGVSLVSLRFPHISLDHIAEYASVVIVSTIVGVSESISVAKTYAARKGARVKVSQEMLALGMGNFVGAMFQVLSLQPVVV